MSLRPTCASFSAASIRACTRRPAARGAARLRNLAPAQSERPQRALPTGRSRLLVHRAQADGVPQSQGCLASTHKIGGIDKPAAFLIGDRKQRGLLPTEALFA